MTDIFEQIVDGVAADVNAWFGKNPVPSSAPPKPIAPIIPLTTGHVTIHVIQPPTNPAVSVPVTPIPKPAFVPLPRPSVPLYIAPGKWTVPAMTAEILRNEGGFVNDPNDSGAATNYGISTPFVEDHRAFFGITHGGPITVADIRAITVQQAAKSYLTFFFVDAHYDLVPNVANIIMQLFDMAVNMGVRERDGESHATVVLQRAIGAVVDGVMGPGTVKALNVALAAHGDVAINNSIVGQRIAFYKSLAAARPKDLKFLAGWINRANKYRA